MANGLAVDGRAERTIAKFWSGTEEPMKGIRASGGEGDTIMINVSVILLERTTVAITNGRLHVRKNAAFVANPIIERTTAAKGLRNHRGDLAS